MIAQTSIASSSGDTQVSGYPRSLLLELYTQSVFSTPKPTIPEPAFLPPFGRETALRREFSY
jgi:hypothetical protein